MSDLTARWHDVRVQLVMLAEGSVTAWNKSGASGKPGHRVLADTTTTTLSVVDVFARRWQGASSDRAREDVIAAAWEHVKHERGHGRPTVRRVESREDIDKRILNARDWTPEDIANSSEYLHTSASRVRKLRRSEGQDPETGRPDHRAIRAKELAAANVSQREIARQVDMSQATVSRVLRRAA